MKSTVIYLRVTHWILSLDQDVVDRLSRISINILGDAQLSGVGVYLEERMCGLFIEAIRQRVEQRPKLRAVCICSDDLKRREMQA